MSAQFDYLNEKLIRTVVQLDKLEQLRAEKQAVLDSSNAQALSLSVEYESAKQEALSLKKKLKDAQEAERLAKEIFDNNHLPVKKTFDAKMSELENQRIQLEKKYKEEIDKHNRALKDGLEAIRMQYDKERTNESDNAAKKIISIISTGVQANETDKKILQELKPRLLELDKLQNEKFCNLEIEFKKKTKEIAESYESEVAKIVQEYRTATEEYSLISNKLIDEYQMKTKINL